MQSNNDPTVKTTQQWEFSGFNDFSIINFPYFCTLHWNPLWKSSQPNVCMHGQPEAPKPWNSQRLLPPLYLESRNTWQLLSTNLFIPGHNGIIDTKKAVTLATLPRSYFSWGLNLPLRRCHTLPFHTSLQPESTLVFLYECIHRPKFTKEESLNSAGSNDIWNMIHTSD